MGTATTPAQASPVDTREAQLALPGALLGVAGAGFGVGSSLSDDGDLATATLVAGALNAISAVSYTSIGANLDAFARTYQPVFFPLAICNAVVGTFDLSLGAYRLASGTDATSVDVHAFARGGPGSAEVVLAGSF